MEDGYSFVWKAKSNQPHFLKPDGTHIYLIVEHYVPYLTTDLANVATAATESGDELLRETKDGPVGVKRVRGGGGISSAAVCAGGVILACENITLDSGDECC